MSWTENNKRQIESLAGCVVAQARIVEMAMIEKGPDGLPIFRLPVLPLFQCSLVELVLADGRVARLSNYQNETTFGICIDFEESVDIAWSLPSSDGGPSIYRVPNDAGFPLGTVKTIKVELDENLDVTQIGLAISGSQIVLKAGEVIEGHGTFSVAEQDSSILLFLNADDLLRVRFSPESYEL